MLDLSLSSILAGVLFGTIGFWLIKEAKNRGNLKWAMIGVVMLGYSYFTKSPWVDWGIGFLLCFAAYKSQD